MNYYVLESLAIDAKRINLKGTTYDANQEILKSVFYKGVSLKNQINPPFTIILNESTTRYGNKKPIDKIPISTIATGFVFLVSSKAKGVLESLNLPLEFYDTVIKGKKWESSDYKYANVIGKIKCVDFAQSKVRLNEREGIIMEYEGCLKLDESKIPKGTGIFLLGEDNTMMIIVNEEVKHAIEAAGLTGFDFIKTEEYSTW